VRYRLRPEDSGFAKSAPKILEFDTGVDAPRDRVFEAIVADPRTWKAWCPGITGGGYARAGEHGVGATRFLGLGGMLVRETVLVYEEPSRWRYRVDAAPIPIARALMETWVLETRGHGTHVRWTVAVDPTPVFHLLLPFPQSMIAALWGRAMRNLGAHLQHDPGVAGQVDRP
jgi:polyketide cyclase/dehydrase/lipid transport protein